MAFTAIEFALHMVLSFEWCEVACSSWCKCHSILRAHETWTCSWCVCVCLWNAHEKNWWLILIIWYTDAYEWRYLVGFFFVVTWKTLSRLLTDEFEGISNGKSSSIVANKTKWGNISTKLKVNESMESWISHKKS